MKLYSDCVSWPGDVQDLIDAQESAEDCSYDVFKEIVDEEDLRQLSYFLGYREGKELQLDTDHHVSFHRSEIKSYPCAFIRHSAIEYVFM